MSIKNDLYPIIDSLYLNTYVFNYVIEFKAKDEHQMVEGPSQKNIMNCKHCLSCLYIEFLLVNSIPTCPTSSKTGIICLHINSNVNTSFFSFRLKTILLVLDGKKLNYQLTLYIYIAHTYSVTLICV